MKPLIPILIIAITLSSVFSAETESGDYDGLDEFRLVTDASSIQPGIPLTIGLWIDHTDEFHTYWKNPGIVGIATMFDWKLPEGWTAGEITWPAPQTTIMATLTAWGYEGDETCLLVTLTPPEKITESEVTLTTRVGWMACARTCHPGWHDFELTLPVSKEPTPPDEKWAEVFHETRKALPRQISAGWELSLTKPDSEGEFTLSFRSPEPLPEDQKAYFFSYDNQVDSDSPQIMDWKDERTIELTLVYPEFAPTPRPDSLRGLLHLQDTEIPFQEIEVAW